MPVFQSGRGMTDLLKDEYPLVKKVMDLIFGSTPQEEVMNVAQPNPLSYGVMPLIYAGKKALGASQPQRWFSNLADKLQRFEINDELAKLKEFIPDIQTSIINSKGNLIGQSNIINKKLSDILQHEQLFKNYPELKNLPFNIDPNIRQSAYFSKGEGLTEPGITMKGKWIQGKEIPGSKGWENYPGRYEFGEEAKDTLLHEIQHAVQDIEGFAKGGSPESYKISTDNAYKINHIRKAIQAKMRIENGEDIKSAVLGVSHHNEIDPNKVLELIKYPIKELTEKEQLLSSMTPTGQYKRLAGEIEARDVASRMGLTEAERMGKMPYAGQGIPLEEWITK